MRNRENEELRNRGNKELRNWWIKEMRNWGSEELRNWWIEEWGVEGIRNWGIEEMRKRKKLCQCPSLHEVANAITNNHYFKHATKRCNVYLQTMEISITRNKVWDFQKLSNSSTINYPNTFMNFIWIIFFVSSLPYTLSRLPYSIKFSQVFKFVNFANFQPFAKMFQRNFLTRAVQCANLWNNLNEVFINHYLQKFRPSKI